MQIRINMKIFIFIVLFYLSQQIEIYSIIMLFAFIHELGHVIAGILLGFKLQKIELMPVGVTVSFKADAKYYNKKIAKGSLLNLKKLIVAIAGPVTNFVIASIFYEIDISISSIIREEIIYANLLIGIFNLLPIYPMDGGRIVKEIIHIKKGLKKATIHINKMSNICIVLITAISSVAIYYFRNISILFIIIYLWFLVIIENKKYRTRMKIYNLIEK